MHVRLYWRMLQNGWWIVTLAALAALNLALLSSYLARPVYRTSTRLIVSPNATLTLGRDLIDSLEALDKRSIVSTYAELLSSTRIYQETGAALEIAPQVLEEYVISTVVLPEANILVLSAEGPDPYLAAQLANGVGQQAIDYLTRLYQVYDVSLLDPAAVPTEPVRPQPVRDASLALALGLALGAVLAILREQLLTPFDALRHRQLIDNISAAFTRRYFQRGLENELAKSWDSIVSLGLIHLDGLYDLVDTLPQPLLQRLLRHVTKTLQNELRGSDIVGRWADTGFAVMLPSTPGRGATRVLERIRLALAEPYELQPGEETLLLKPFAGVAVRQNGEAASTLIEQAEIALEQARQNESRTVLFSAERQPDVDQIRGRPQSMNAHGNDQPAVAGQS
jgi:diguanylate cyclase (GGDEF)-like protein